MQKRGGKRLGAGRPKGLKNKKTLEDEALRDVFRKKVQEKWDDLIDAQIKDAIKNYKARQYIFDRLLGKSRIEESGINEGVSLIIDINA